MKYNEWNLNKSAEVHVMPFEDYHYSDVDARIPDKEYDAWYAKHTPKTWRDFQKALFGAYQGTFDAMLAKPGDPGWSVPADRKAGDKLEDLGVYSGDLNKWYTYNQWKTEVAKALKEKRDKDAEKLMAVTGFAAKTASIGSNEWKGMNKEATPGIAKYLATAWGGLSDVGAQSLILLLAAAGSVGGTAGYLGAKLNSRDKQDIDTIQKEYENERLKSDLGYLTAKTDAEYNKLQNQTKPKAARIFA